MNRGFTLIEILIVVAIIAILAAVAIPQYRNFQIKALRSEAVLQLNAMQKAQYAYYGTYSHFANNQLLELGSDYNYGSTLKHDWYVSWLYSSPLSPGYSGYYMQLQRNMNADSGLDIFAIKHQMSAMYPTCPDDIPYLYRDDITGIFGC